MPTYISGAQTVTSFIAPATVEDTFPTHKPIYGLGGVRTVGTTAEMESISVDRREEGMIVYVKGITAYYALIGTTANAGWTTGFTFGRSVNNITDYVVSFNGLTGAVGGVTTSVANTFTALQTFNAGVSTSYLYSSNGSTFASSLHVVGGSTFASSVDVTGFAKFNGNVTVGDSTTDVLTVTSGSTFGVTDHSGVARFSSGITTSTLDAISGIRANGGLTASTLDVSGVSKFTGGATFSSSADFASSARFAVGLNSSGNVVVGSAGTVLNSNGDATVGATLTVNGNFFVQGTVTTVNRTDLAVDDKIITLGRTLSSDTLADGGGLVLKGSSDRTLTWSDSADAWTSNDNFNVGSAYGYKVDNTTVLASGMIHGLSASAGSISGGTWAANIIGLAYGGTNKNLVSVGASGGVVFKDGTGLSITAAGTNGQILQANASGAPTWVNLTSLTGLTADSVKITDRDTTSGTMYLTFTTDVGAAMSLFIDKSSGVTYDANTNVLSCFKLEATVDGGTF